MITSGHECEEPRCNRLAVRTWGGRQVCQDHYEEYKEEQERRIFSMRDY
ncbi:hypothetical protein HYU22_05480 [Candidatus Woesearchaeota archaeon]|nr:hypothetical protein [Candidatus Woesearchaeota archaeon]